MLTYSLLTSSRDGLHTLRIVIDVHILMHASACSFDAIEYATPFLSISLHRPFWVIIAETAAWYIDGNGLTITLHASPHVAAGW